MCHFISEINTIPSEYPFTFYRQMYQDSWYDHVLALWYDNVVYMQTHFLELITAGLLYSDFTSSFGNFPSGDYHALEEA